MPLETGLCCRFVLCVPTLCADGLGLCLLSEELCSLCNATPCDLPVCWPHTPIRLRTSPVLFFSLLDWNGYKWLIFFFFKCLNVIHMLFWHNLVGKLVIWILRCRCGAVFCGRACHQRCWNSCKRTPGFSHVTAGEESHDLLLYIHMFRITMKRNISSIVWCMSEMACQTRKKRILSVGKWLDGCYCCYFV